MKKIILTVFFILTTVFCFGQKMLSEVNLKNTQLEEIDPASIPDIEAYQREKFKNPRGRFTSTTIRSGGFSKLYKFKGSDDLIIIAPRLDKELIENWDKAILGYLETYMITSDDGYVEHINIGNAKAVIFFIKNYRRGNNNYILYQNIKKGITLYLLYI
ncbi:hypothetical protein EIM50_23900, partial [Pseudoxanthomonas sp. SGD-10]